MPPKVSSEQTLIFDWERSRSRLGRLSLAMLAVLAGLALFFYVFRVVYPQSERFTPVPHQVVMLNAADPLSAPIMNKVRDIDFLLLPSRVGDGGVLLQDHAPVFHPSFEGHELRLQDLPHRPFTAPSPRLLQADELTLPPLDLSELKGKPASTDQLNDRAKSRSARLRMQFHDLPEDRLPRSLPDLAEVPTMDPANYRFRIGVAEDGRVTFALPLGTPDLPEVGNLLTERVMRLRFAPVDREKEKMAAEGKAKGKDVTQAGVQWGEVSFEWSESP